VLKDLEIVNAELNKEHKMLSVGPKHGEGIGSDVLIQFQ
jgi:hypothetical protein